MFALYENPRAGTIISLKQIVIVLGVLVQSALDSVGHYDVHTRYKTQYLIVDGAGPNRESQNPRFHDADDINLYLGHS